jgi:anaerobic ribonucleoside-triphosphate reductase activating protein
MPRINLADWVSITDSEGPGSRFALWTQGCLKRCRSCCNPHMLALVPRRIVDCDWLLDEIRASQHVHRIEGVTFLGGEPFLQARGLSHVAKGCREAGLSVIVFTGYTREELEHLALPYWQALMSYADVVVDGPYVRELAEHHRNWVGSSNQRFHYVTDRYTSDIETGPHADRRFEIRIGSGGELRVNGWPADC